MHSILCVMMFILWSQMQTGLEFLKSAQVKGFGVKLSFPKPSNKIFPADLEQWFDRWFKYCDLAVCPNVRI